MKNQVVAGDYINWDVVFHLGKVYLMHMLTKIEITRSVVRSWNVVDDVEKNSIWGPIIGAGIGNTLFGTAGAFAGALIGKRTNVTYLVSVEFIDGKRSLLQLDAKGYNGFIKGVY